MLNALENSAFFGMALSIGIYCLGSFLQQKYKFAVLNPLLISIAVIILILKTTHIDFDIYYSGAKYLSYFLTPATVCLAVPLYEKSNLLKDNWKALSAGIVSGVLTALICVFIMSLLFNFSHEEYVTFLPKSITTAIGMGISEELGGNVSLTIASIIITGIIGNIFAPIICRIFKINKSIAKGIAIGTSSHVIGTARAMEMGKTEGAVSSLSIVISGLLTVLGASVFAQLL